MTDYKSTIAELRYLADWAKHHLDKAKIANDAADAIEALQSKLGDAIRSLANWQHQCTELQAENERLCSGLSECRDAFPVPERGSEIERDWMAAMGEPEAVSDYVKVAANALQARLDAMGKGEAIYQFKRGDGSWFDQTKASYDYNVKCGVSGLRIVYAAPKALAPLKDEPWMVKAINEAYGIGGAP